MAEVAKKTTTKTTKAKPVTTAVSKPAKKTVKKATEATAKSEVKAAKVAKTNKLSKLLRKGAQVEIIAGKFKGQKAQVVKYKRAEAKVWLEKINEQIDYKKASQEGGGSGKSYKAMPLAISKVKLVIK